MYGRCFFVLAGAVVAASVSAATVSNVSISQDPATARVTVRYDLSSDAIVTLDVATNGVSVGVANMRRMAGDVNRRITAGAGKSAYWFPAADFPGRYIADSSLTVSVKAWAPSSPPDYMVCDLSVTNGVTYYVSEAALPHPVTSDVYKTTHFVMRRIHAAGRPWRMGAPANGETGAVSGSEADRTVTHNVILTNDYWIGVYPVTQRQYYFFTGGYRDGGSTGASFNSGDEAPMRPMDSVSYDMLRGTDHSWPADGHAAGGVLKKIRALTGLAGLDLPTEAQWEFACRAGTGTGYNNGLDCTTAMTSGAVCPNLAKVGWYGGNPNANTGNANKTTHPVGLLEPNAWGLYDCHGNVWELCLDKYSTGADYKATFAVGWDSGAPTIDPKGPSSGSQCVTRGGNWYQAPCYARSCWRGPVDTNTASYHYGFRLACIVGME